MPKKFILALDQGTTGSRAIIYDAEGKVAGSSYQEFKQYYPKPGWVEHDVLEIWDSVCSVIKGAVSKARIQPHQIAAIGITNQRETTVLWDRKTSRPVGRAIVWQCRRTSQMCADKKLRQHSGLIYKKTGLVLDPYFSGTKVKWFLDSIKGLRRRARAGDICFGTIDSWLIWKLTNGASHATDTTNASRTLLFNIRSLSWDKELLKIFTVPEKILPRVYPSGSHFGKTARTTSLPSGIPILAVLGDQQAALYGQGCFTPGSIKNTYGTGCFLMLNTGKKCVYSKGGLLTTIASDEKGQPVYALEGAVFIAGAVVQWLRDGLKIIKSSSETENAIRGLKDTADVYIVPAFTGLGAPYWDSNARGIIAGLTRGAGAAHIIRAALESIAYQTKDVFEVMKKDLNKNIMELNVDGGACKNNFLMQFQADMLSCRIVRPKVTETTAQGAAFLAGVKAGIWKGVKQIQSMIAVDKIFKPTMKNQKRAELYKGWQEAVERARSQS